MANGAYRSNEAFGNTITDTTTTTNTGNVGRDDSTLVGISTFVVPEPATWAMLAVGAALLIGFRRRRHGLRRSFSRSLHGLRDSSPEARFALSGAVHSFSCQRGASATGRPRWSRMRNTTVSATASTVSGRW